MASNRQATVVAVKDVSSKTPKEEWMEDRLLPGDIVEEVASAESGVISAPFAGGKTGLEDELRQMFRTTDVISVSVRRGHTVTDLRACVVSEESVMPKKHYTLRSFNDTRHVVVLVDSSEDECLKWQGIDQLWRGKVKNAPIWMHKGVFFFNSSSSSSSSDAKHD